MNNLVAHAKMELEAAGLFDKDSDYNGMLGDAVVELVEVFAGQGHSGFSASIVTGLVNKLFKYEPLGPLTGEDSEWTELDLGADHMTHQNKRCSHVFKEKGGKAYDSQGKVFLEPDGTSFTNEDSKVYITFPYTPTNKYVDFTEYKEGLD